jgi:hypothetical protein
MKAMFLCKHKKPNITTAIGFCCHKKGSKWGCLEQVDWRNELFERTKNKTLMLEADNSQTLT